MGFQILIEDLKDLGDLQDLEDLKDFEVFFRPTGISKQVNKTIFCGPQRIFQNLEILGILKILKISKICKMFTTLKYLKDLERLTSGGTPAYRSHARKRASIAGHSMASQCFRFTKR